MSQPTPEQLNSLFPVIGIVKYPGGIQVRRGNYSNFNQAKYLHVRGKQILITSRSLNKLALLVRGSSVMFRSIQTLTYGANYPLSGRIAKKHLNSYLVQSKRLFGPYNYIWILEFQGRGAVHFHIATTLAPPSDLERHGFAKLWQRVSTPYSWWYSSLEIEDENFKLKKELYTDQAVYEVHLSSKSWERVKKDDSLSRYFAKYANKIKQKSVPDFYSDVGRFWGASKGVALPDGEPFWGSDRDVRELAKEFGRDIDHWRVLPKVILLG